MKNSYWEENSRYQAQMNYLQTLIPDVGRIDGKTNTKLEKLRRAINCYYDLYNNGLCNHTRSFRDVFGVAPSLYRGARKWEYNETLYDVVEQKMDVLVLEAADEQNIYPHLIVQL